MLISLLQVVQTGVDLVQHGVGGCPYCSSGEATVLAFHAHIYRYTLFHMASDMAYLCTHKAHSALERGGATWVREQPGTLRAREVIKTLCSLKSCSWGKESKTVSGCPD